MNKLNNKGLTLVEIIVSILILGICATMLAFCFSGALKIVNRASLYKMESSTASSTVELEAKQEASNGDYSISKFAYEEAPNLGLEVTYTKNGAKCTTKVKGQYLVATSEGVNDTKISYKEFLSSNIGFNVNTEDVD